MGDQHMSSKSTRRSFVKKAALGATAMAFVSRGSARAFAANEKVRLGWIGYGGRATGLLSHMLQNCPDAVHAAFCDLRPERVEGGQKGGGPDKAGGCGGGAALIR